MKNFGVNNYRSDDMGYESLLEYADEINVCVKEAPLYMRDGSIKDRNIAIRKDIPTLKEKYCVLAEELGHYQMNVGDITNLNDYRNYKQELQGRHWGYNRTVGLLGIIRAFERGCKSIYEMADFLNVTEPYLIEALEWYKSKYGIYTKVDNYIIYFQPLIVGKII